MRALVQSNVQAYAAGQRADDARVLLIDAQERLAASVSRRECWGWRRYGRCAA